MVSSSLLLMNPLVAWAAEEEGVNVVPSDIGLWIWTLATFLVMFLLLAKLAFKPIAEALDRRAKAIQQQLTDAQKDREEAQKLMAGYEKQIAEARGEAAKLIEEARSMSEELRRDIVEKAKEEAGEVIERAQEEIERQKDKGIQDLRETVATLSVQIASKVLEKEVDETRHRDLVEDLIQELGTVRNTSR
jgi:F-type H+-transporting ATPase subunit b